MSIFRDDELTLEALRLEIDATDRHIQELLERRTEIVSKLGEIKKAGTRTAPSSAMRPGREAKIIRRLFETHQGLLPVTALAGIWRSIISSYLRLQYPFTVHVANNMNGIFLRDMARIHFGPDTPMKDSGDAQDVIDRVIRDPFAVGVIGAPAIEDAKAWWKLLPPAAPGKPQVVARLPFVETGDISTAAGYVIARTDREESGDDVTWLRLTNANADLISRLAGDRDVQVILSEQVNDLTDCLLCVDGYLVGEDNRLARWRHMAEDTEAVMDIIGGYAVPVHLKDKPQSSEY